jgi:hypothetical protein
LAKKETGLKLDPETPTAAAGARPAAPRITWDDAGMSNSYANVCNVIGTREEIAVFFGMSIPGTRDGDVGVALSQRILLNPFAAKRLAALLSNIVEQYEARWGALGEDAPPAGTSR